MDNKVWFVDSGIIAQRSRGKGFEEIHCFQFMRWHKEAFGAVVEKNIESIIGNFEDNGAAILSKLIDVRKSPSPALVE